MYVELESSSCRWNIGSFGPLSNDTNTDLSVNVENLLLKQIIYSPVSYKDKSILNKCFLKLTFIQTFHVDFNFNLFTGY